MKRKNPPMAWDLPLVIDPPETICFQINVPNERFHLAAFYGAIYLLTRWYAWKPDAGHTGRLVGKVWMKIFDKLIGGQCTIPPKQGSAGAEGDENLIRQNPDNPCELQTSIDGINWCTFADLSLCIPAAPQAGGQGSTPPAPGECRTFKGDMGGQSPWYVPALVTTGDTLNLIPGDGIFYDGGSLAWFCPDGFRFVVSCTGIQFFDAGSQMPSVPIGRIVAKIGTTYYDIQGGPFTVPGGHTNDPVQLEMNSPNPSLNGGDVQLSIEVCNNQETSWTHTFDFAPSTQGWFAVSNGGVFNSWNIGGWVQANDTSGGCSPSPSDRGLLGIAINMPSPRFITSIRVLGNTDTDKGPGNGLRAALVDSTQYNLGIDASTGDFDATVTPGATASTSLSVYVNSLCFASPPNITVFKVIVSGTGTDPF